MSRFYSSLCSFDYEAASGDLRCTKAADFSKIGQSVTELLRFNHFQYGRFSDLGFDRDYLELWTASARGNPILYQHTVFGVDISIRWQDMPRI